MKKLILLLFTVLLFVSCSDSEPVSPITSDSGIKKASAKIVAGSDGLTVEQRNISKRYAEDNKVGSVKHLYVISAYSGQVIIYSTVEGKVTSGGKRLTSPDVLVSGDNGEWRGDFVMNRIQDDGTYGSSDSYLYWWDSKGIYHQHYISGGQIVTISSEPMPVKEILINLSK